MKYFGKVLLISLLGSLLLWVVESVYAIAVGTGLVEAPGRAVFFLLLLLLFFAGWGVVAGIAQALWISAIGAVYRRVSGSRGRLCSLALAAGVVTATLAPYVVYFSSSLFSGEGILKSPYILYLKVGFPLAGLLALFLLAGFIIANVGTWLLPSRRAVRAAVTVLAALLLVWLYSSNARLFVGQYGFIHQAASLVMFVLAEFIIVNLLGERRLSRRGLGTVARIAVAAAFAALAVVAASGHLCGLSPGSRQLSLLHTRGHLGKQLVWLYGPGEAGEQVDPRYHEEYLARRDEYLRSASRLSREGYNFIWIMVDALRADHLPMYGYGRDTSPRLKKLADRSLLFLRNYAQGPNTGTSLAAQMTGCYTSTLRRRGGIGSVDTLAEMLSRKGYQTWAVAQKWDIKALGKKGKEGAGFDRIIVAGHIPAPEINDAAIELMEGRDRDRPFFLFAFYYEPHDPYEKHEGFDYGDAAMDLYDSEISYLDRCFADIFGYLLEGGYDRNTVLLVTADHGDEIGQHGGWGHHWKLYDCLIHVPFILYVPGVDPAVISEPIHSIDMAASMVDLLGLWTESELDGSSFLPYLTGGDPPFIPRIFSEADSESSKKVCLNQYPWKLVYHMSDSYFELFNLETDPGETVNKISENPAVAAGLKKGLLSWLSHRDRGFQTGEGVEDARLKEICARLARHDPAAIDGLAALADADIGGNDFVAVVEAVKPYFSGNVAEFLITQAQENPAVRAAALEALVPVIKRADAVLGGSDNVIGETFGTVQFDEAGKMFAVLSEGGRPRFLLSLVAGGDEETAGPALEILSRMRVREFSDGLYSLYGKENDPGKRRKLFEALCMVGDPRVEAELLGMVDGVSDYHTLTPLIPLFVNYRTEGPRAFLFRITGYGGWFLPRLTAAIGRTENDYMLPVLRKIYSAGRKSGDVSHSARTFSRKMAILNYVRIKGRDNLDTADRQGIREACGKDPHLTQYESIRTLYDEL